MPISLSPASSLTLGILLAGERVGLKAWHAKTANQDSALNDRHLPSIINKPIPTPFLAHGSSSTTMPTGPSHRPQTLKQAKKAYRKSGATARLSESELALIERRAVLQERADRIREREARRKANLKRKEERNQKEREARQRMRIPSPTKGGFHVGPSQLHLGDFMVMGGKRKREEAPSFYGKVGNSNRVNTESGGCQAATELPPSCTPLQEASANTMNKVESRNKTEHPQQSEQGFEDPQKSPTRSMRPLHACNSLHIPNTKPSALPRPAAELHAFKVEGEGKKAINLKEALPMGPPPLPNSLKTKSSPNTHQARSLLAPQGNPPNISLDPWDDFFVSNTQIVREISLTALSQAPKSATPTKMPSSPSPPSKDETTSLLSLLSTQDLDTSDILTQPLLRSPPAPDPTTTPPKPPIDTTDITTTISSLLQISTQDLDFSNSSTPSKSQRKGSSDFNEEVTEEDLEDLVLEYEMQSSWGSKGEEKVAEREGEGNEEKVHEDEDEDEVFGSEFSTQDWRELGVVECG